MRCTNTISSIRMSPMTSHPWQGHTFSEADALSKLLEIFNNKQEFLDSSSPICIRRFEEDILGQKIFTKILDSLIYENCSEPASTNNAQPVQHSTPLHNNIYMNRENITDHRFKVMKSEFNKFPKQPNIIEDNKFIQPKNIPKWNPTSNLLHHVRKKHEKACRNQGIYSNYNVFLSLFYIFKQDSDKIKFCDIFSSVIKSNKTTMSDENYERRIIQFCTNFDILHREDTYSRKQKLSKSKATDYETIEEYLNNLRSFYQPLLENKALTPIEVYDTLMDKFKEFLPCFYEDVCNHSGTFSKRNNDYKNKPELLHQMALEYILMVQEDHFDDYFVNSQSTTNSKINEFRLKILQAPNKPYFTKDSKRDKINRKEFNTMKDKLWHERGKNYNNISSKQHSSRLGDKPNYNINTIDKKCSSSKNTIKAIQWSKEKQQASDRSHKLLKNNICKILVRRRNVNSKGEYRIPPKYMNKNYKGHKDDYVEFEEWRQVQKQAEKILKMLLSNGSNRSNLLRTVQGKVNKKNSRDDGNDLMLAKILNSLA